MNWINFVIFVLRAYEKIHEMGTNKITGNNMKNSKLRLHIETEISALLDSSLLEDETTELESDELSD